MTRPLYLLLAALLARPAFASQGGAKIPTDPGPTAASLSNLTADTSFEGQRSFYDGANRGAAIGGYTLRNPLGPNTGGGSPTAGQRTNGMNAAPPAGKPKEAKKKEFFDNETVGFAALGVLAGGVIGFGLMGALGILGPIGGALIGAALLVGLFKWKGYTKPEKK